MTLILSCLTASNVYRISDRRLTALRNPELVFDDDRFTSKQFSKICSKTFYEIGLPATGNGNTPLSLRFEHQILSTFVLKTPSLSRESVQYRIKTASKGAAWVTRKETVASIEFLKKKAGK